MSKVPTVKSFAKNLDLLYADATIPADNTGSLQQIAALMAPLQPSSLFLVDGEQCITAAYSASGTLDEGVLRSAAGKLKSQLAGNDDVFIQSSSDEEAGTLFGIGLASGGILGGLLPQGGEASIAVECLVRQFRTCGQLAAAAIERVAEVRQLQVALRQLTAGQDTLPLFARGDRPDRPVVAAQPRCGIGCPVDF